MGHGIDAGIQGIRRECRLRRIHACQGQVGLIRRFVQPITLRENFPRTSVSGSLH